MCRQMGNGEWGMRNVFTYGAPELFIPYSTFNIPHLRFEQQVRGFYVAVDDAHLMGVVEGFGGLNA